MILKCELEYTAQFCHIRIDLSKTGKHDGNMIYNGTKMQLSLQMVRYLLPTYLPINNLVNPKPFQYRMKPDDDDLWAITKHGT